MKKLTKVLSILLAVALAVTGFMLAVSADDAKSEVASYTVNGETVTGTLVEALSAADENSTVKLEGNCTLGETVTVTKNVTLDLNGYTLTAEADAFVIGANNVNFKIVGTGSINLAGKLVSAAKDYTGFEVTVAGNEKSEGISISHVDSNIVSTYHGNWNFKNLKVVSTAVLLEGDAYFKTVRDNTATAVMNFNFVSFDSTAVPYQSSTGNFVVSIAGEGSVNVDNSAFRTQNSGIYAAHGLDEGPLTGIISIKNSTVSCIAKDTNKGRNYVVLGMDHKFTKGIDNSQNGFNGMLVVENSLVECNVRMFTFGTVDTPSIYIDSSTMRIAGNSGTDNSYSFVRGAGEITISGNCKWISHETKLSNVPNGTRANLASVINLTADQKMVYDPVGDVDAPFIVVAKDDALSSPDFYRNYGFDSIRLHKDTNGNRDISIGGIDGKANQNQSWVVSDPNGDGKTGDSWTKDPYWFIDRAKGMQWDNKYGTITHMLNEESSYVKYWIQPDGTGSSTVKLHTSTKTDTYFVMGLGSDGDYTNSKMHPTAMSGADRKSVVIAEFDFTTEEGGIGYPYMQVIPQARDSANQGATHAKSFTINNAGSIVDTGRLQNKPEVMPALNPAGVWNRLSAVCYSDPANSEYRVYFYLNGVLMGYDTLYNPDYDNKLQIVPEYFYFQGIRLSFSNDHQKVNSNLLIDNVSIRAYTDYQFEGEKDSDYDAETGTYANNGVYKPELYIAKAPASQYVKPDVTVGGLEFDDINEALAFATKNNTVVDINRDIKAEITANGIINTNGYKLEAIGDSYGYIANGNLVEFNANYQYEAWFYIGSLDKTEFADSDFEKVIVKIGDKVDKDYIYTNYDNKIFADKTLVGGQNGWAYVNGATESVLPKIADLSDIEKAENGVIKYFPVMGAIPMTYYVNDANGTTYAGDITSEQALIDFRALKDGDTFVLQSDINISEAENTFVNKGTINIDLNGNTLSLSKAGRFVVIGSNTTLNVYSSKAGGTVNCVTYSGSAKGNQAFVIDDPAVIDNNNLFESPDLANNVTNAVINLGGNGVKMTVVAEVALKGRVGDDSCRITSDGVDFTSPDNTINRAVFDAQLFNGEIYVKNAFILAINKFNIVNLDGFYKTEDTKDEAGNKTSSAYKPDKDSTGKEIELSNRQPGFENTIMTGYMELENCIIVNRLSGLNNDSVKDNILSNNGDGSSVRKNLKFKNVVATGRFNPSNVSRTIFEGFVAVEHYDMGNNVLLANDTVKATYTRPMTLDMIDLGINTVDGIYTCAIQYYDAESGEMVTANEYKIANGGVTANGAYTLPNLKGATAYSSDVFTVTYNNIAGDDALATEKYVKGSIFTLKSGVEVPAYTAKFVTLTSNGNWTNVPEYVTENVTLTPGYTASVALTGVMANLSLYSDFDVNLYIPAEYMDNITIAENYNLADATLNGKDYKVITVTQACNNITANITVTINMSETVLGVEYTDTKVINYSVAKYAETALASEAMDDSTKLLVYYMLNYANEAAKYLNGAGDDKLTAMIEANKTLADMNPHTPGNDPLVTPDAVAKLGSVFTQATLTLDPKPAYVFTVADSFVGTVTIANGTNVRTYNFTENTDRTIVIDGMKAYNFVATLAITAEGTVNGETVTLTDGVYNLAAFEEYHANNSGNADSAACLPLVNAFRTYADYAYFYKMGVWAW